MKKSKTLYEWLSTKLVFNIRNEETFAMRASFRLSYSQVIMYLFGFFVVFLFVYTWLLNNFLGNLLNPEFKQVQMNRKYIKLKKKVDSLEVEIKLRDQNLDNIKNIINSNH